MMKAETTGNVSAKVLDFGLAKIANTDVSQCLTQTGEVIGTPLYMSPEQFQSNPVDARSDVYSLGAVMYECLSGQPPHKGDTVYATLFKALNEKPNSIAQAGKPISRQLQRIIFKCLEVEAADRYQNASELLADLTRVAEGKSIQRQLPRFRLQSKFSIKPRTAGIVAAGIVLLGVGAGYLIKLKQEPPLDRPDNLKQELTPYRPDKVNGRTLADLNASIETDPKDADAYYDRAMFHRARDERDNAIDDFTTAIELDSLNSWAYFYRSTLYELIHKMDLALADTNRMIELFPTWNYGFSQRASVKNHMQRYHESITDAQKALALEPNDTHAIEAMGAAYDALGDHQKALDCAEKQIETAKKIEDQTQRADTLYFAYRDRAVVLLHMHRLQPAREDLNRALQFHKNEPTLWAYLACINASGNNMPAALRCIKQTLSLDPYPARANRFSGEMYRAAGRWEDAAASYSTSTSLEPWFGPGYFQRAMTEIPLGQLNSAESDLKKSIASDPDSAASNSFLAVVEDQLGRSEAAQKRIIAAFKLTPDLPINYVNRARISLRQQKITNAIEDCNRAITLDNFLADAYATRAIALELVGSTSEASKDRKTAQRLGWHNFSVSLKVAKAPSASKYDESISIVRPQLTELKPGQSIQWPKFESTLTAQQTWALACGTIWLEKLSQDAFRCQKLQAWNPNEVSHARKFLAKNFNCPDRDSLLKRITSFEAETKNSPKDMAAFQSVRSIVLCQVGVNAHYLSEQEAWQRIMPIAGKIQLKFDSWEDLGQCYLRGREVFFHGKPPHREDFIKAVEKVLAEGPARRLPFKMPLD